VLYILSEAPSEGSGTRTEDGVFAEDVLTSVLSFVSARGPDLGATRYCPAALGCGGGRGGLGCQTRRTVVQHRRASGACISGRMCVPHAHLARTRWDASGRNRLQERRSHKHYRKPLQGARVHLEVSVK